MPNDLKAKPVVFRYQTQNGVQLRVESWPRENINNRGRVVGLDYDQIFTTICLDVFDNPKDYWKAPSLMEGIAELEDEHPDIKNSAMNHLREDLKEIVRGLGGSEFDYTNLFEAVLQTRQDVLSEEA